jgi:hypothetical protein
VLKTKVVPTAVEVGTSVAVGLPRVSKRHENDGLRRCVGQSVVEHRWECSAERRPRRAKVTFTLPSTLLGRPFALKGCPRRGKALRVDKH